MYLPRRLATNVIAAQRTGDSASGNPGLNLRRETETRAPLGFPFFLVDLWACRDECAWRGVGCNGGRSFTPTRSAVTALRTPPRAVWAGLVGPFGFSFSFAVAIFSFFFYGNFYDLFLI
jgi:hypothetical protein